jgi:MFS family permease
VQDPSQPLERQRPNDRLSLRTKTWFGVGTVGESATNWLFNALTFLYYQQILGLSGSLAGTAVAIAIFFDAISDPLIGSISDRFRSRWGRRHPFMIAAPIPLVLSIFLIFNPPESVVTSQMMLFGWFTVFTICMRTFVTFFAIPHLAMGAELSSDYIERTNVMSFNNLFGYYGALMISNGRCCPRRSTIVPTRLCACCSLLLSHHSSHDFRLRLVYPRPDSFHESTAFRPRWILAQRVNVRHLDGNPKP